MFFARSLTIAILCVAFVTTIAIPAAAQSGKPASRPRPTTPTDGSTTPPADSKGAADFLENWASWAKATIKGLQDAKTLAGQDLSSTRVTVGAVEANLERLKRAAKMEEVFEKADTEAIKRCLLDIDAMLDRLIKDGVVRTKDKKAAITELETSLKAIEVRITALSARKTLLYRIGQDLQSLYVRLNAGIDRVKLDPDPKRALVETISPLERVGAACSEAAQRDGEQYEKLNDRSTRINDALTIMRSL